MKAEASSIWLVVGPALIAGGIGLVSAGLSFVSARQSLSHTAEAEQAARDHQLDLLVYNRRLAAIETIWQSLFEVERTRQLPDQSRIEVVRAAVWLPEETRKGVLETLIGFQAGNPTDDSLKKVRELLLQQTTTMSEQ